MFVSRQRQISTEAQLKISGLKKILGLEAGRNEYRIVYGASSTNRHEIAVLTRSLIEIIIELSSYIHIPEKHIEEGRSFATFLGPMNKSKEFGPLI